MYGLQFQGVLANPRGLKDCSGVGAEREAEASTAEARRCRGGLVVLEESAESCLLNSSHGLETSLHGRRRTSCSGARRCASSRRVGHRAAAEEKGAEGCFDGGAHLSRDAEVDA